MHMLKTLTIIPILLLLFGSMACVEVGDMEVDTRTVELEGAETVVLEVRMGAGELNIHGGARELMDATFAYNVDKWKPRVKYEVLGRKGILKIRQGKSSGVPMGSTRNKWDISLSENVPIGIKINFGAGEGNLDLRELQLESLDIDMGVGDLEVDLSGERQDDLRVDVDGGVGSATFYLPVDIGVRVHVDKGIGSVDAHGLRKDGKVYKNDAYGTSKASINISIDAGIGSITLKTKGSEYVRK
ncbi:toast rack family protein [Acidobacteriota bacterium]